MKTKELQLPTKHRAIRVLNDGLGMPIVRVLVLIYAKYRSDNDVEEFKYRYTHDRLQRSQLLFYRPAKEKAKGYKVGISDHSFSLKRNPAFPCDFPDAREIYDFTFIGKGSQRRDIWRIERIK